MHFGRYKIWMAGVILVILVAWVIWISGLASIRP